MITKCLVMPMPTRTPNQKRQQTIFIFCPEQTGSERQLCDAEVCGGDTKPADFCDKILISGPQAGCPIPGCGTYCQCIPMHGERPVPTNQIIFQVCPEALGEPKKKCSDCGGDSKNLGVCNNILLNGNRQGCLLDGCRYYCDSIGGWGSAPLPPGNPTKLVTSVANGETVTATFQVMTLSEWEDLRSHTTITTSVSSQEKKAAIAIFAGGVAWWFLGWYRSARLKIRSP